MLQTGEPESCDTPRFAITGGHQLGPSGFNPVQVPVRLMWLGWIRRLWPASGAFALLTRVDHECLTIAANTAMVMIRSRPVPVA